MSQRDREEKRIAVLYEHPDWFKPLFAELDKRGVSYEEWPAHRHGFDPRVRTLPYSLVINRMSPSAYLREHGNGIFYVRQLLRYLDDIQVPVINSHHAFMVETSKALQVEIFEQLGLSYPRTRVINDPALALDASQGMEFPVVVKPNIGGSGARIRKFASRDQLREAVRANAIDPGFDSTALVQEFLPASEGSIVRVEIMDGKFLYAIKIFTAAQDGSFNLCPADICQDESPSPEEDLGRCLAAQATEKRRLHIEAYKPPEGVIADALAIAREASFDVGGIEYLVNQRDGQIYFYDVNALSNFVTDAPRILGFDPYERFVDFVLARSLQAA